MRLRHIPGAEEQIAESQYVVQQPTAQKGCWNQLFQNENPIEIEVGMGKGKFVMELAQQNPQINYVGIERYSSVLLKALQKREELCVKNLYFLCIDALGLPDFFAAEEVSKIYLNFSDPWPKDRHTKRRLTSKQFMDIYGKILKNNGVIEFKTDNKGLFEYSLESIPDAGWHIKSHTFDLHNSDMLPGNVMTEYETKFVLRGNQICKLIAFR